MFLLKGEYGNEVRTRHTGEGSHALRDGGGTGCRCQAAQRDQIEPYPHDNRTVAEVAEAALAEEEPEPMTPMLNSCATYTLQGEVLTGFGLSKLTKAPIGSYPSTKRAQGGKPEQMFRTYVQERTIYTMQVQSIVPEAVHN